MELEISLEILCHLIEVFIFYYVFLSSVYGYKEVVYTVHQFIFVLYQLSSIILYLGDEICSSASDCGIMEDVGACITLTKPTYHELGFTKFFPNRYVVMVVLKGT